MTFERFQHPPPVYWEEFEDFCLSLFRAVWKCPSAQKNGRRGDAQHGVDVSGCPSCDRWVAVQCKGKDALYGSEVTEAELRKEVAKALTFKPALSSWTFATSGPKSAAVEAEARRITEEHRPRGLFEVHVMGWEDLRHVVADHPEVIEKHFPDVAPSHRLMAQQIQDLHAAFNPSRAGSRAQPTELLIHGSSPATEGAGLDAVASARLRSTLGAASSLLLNWPTTTGGQWFTRPELDALVGHVTADAPKPLIVLGPPGAGKSAVLARLGNNLARRGVALLALKADAIPRHVASAAQLDEFLSVPEPLDASLRRLAADQPVVLLIDQLDALADLMDQHGGRLNALLRLVAQVRGCPRLAVVLSCREFEFRHDARLTTLEAEAVTLQPVDWAEVEAVLRTRGLSPEGWHPEFREVLRVPQHLDIFLRYLADSNSQVPFTSYHGMLEEVFRRRVVLAGPEGGENVAALYAVARAMGEEEDLWVPAARFDAQAAAVDRMEAAGFLHREGSRLGFRHQTLFDFVRARAFVAAGESVAAYALARQETIFARPTVWSALSYLRIADRAAYEREVQQVWEAQGVRPHLRSLLRDLMGRHMDPSDREAHRLMPLLTSPSTTARTLRAMIGSKGWFHRLLPRMPDLMADAGETGWVAATILRFMVNEEAPTVIGLMQRCWKDAGRHRQVTHVLDDLRDWTPEALDLATAVLPSMDSFSVVHLAGKMRQLSGPDMAGFILARLEAVLAAAQAQPSPREAMKGFLQSSIDLYGLPEIMMRASGTFARVLWPWVARVVEHLASPPYCSGTYRPDGGGMLTRFGNHDAGAESRFGIAYAQVVAAWAGAEPEAFLEFAGAAVGSDLCALHCILAEGYVAVAADWPRAVLDYLAGDPRRLRLGDVTDSDHVTRRLISAAAAHLDGLGVQQLAAAIRALAFERELGRFELATQRDFIRWNRETRLRLLLCIPEATRSAELARFIEGEVRAVGVPAPEQGIRMVHGEAVRMSGAAMRKAKDKDIIRFLRPHPDSSDWAARSMRAREGALMSRGLLGSSPRLTRRAPCASSASCRRGSWSGPRLRRSRHSRRGACCRPGMWPR